MAKSSWLLFICIILATSQIWTNTLGATTPTSVNYLVAFFEFEDLTHTKSIEQLSKAAVTDVESFYSQVSYGKIKVTGTVISRWIVLPVKVSGLKVSVWDFDSNDMQMLDGYARIRSVRGRSLGARKLPIQHGLHERKLRHRCLPA